MKSTPCCPPFLVAEYDPSGAVLVTCPWHPGGWFRWHAPQPGPLVKAA